MGAGQMTGGAIGAVGGGIGAVGAFIGELPSGGAATLVLAPSVAEVANGITSLGQGWTNFQVGGAKAGGTSAATSPPNDHHVFPQEFREWFAGGGRNIDIDKFMVELPENVHLDQLHAQNIDTSAGPMNFKPGGIWNENWRQFIDANQNATAGQVMEFGRTMCVGFGIAGCP